MIVDDIRNASAYGWLGAGTRAALDYLAVTDLSGLAPGRHDIDADRVFALVQRYETKPRSTGEWEAHRKFIDVQYVIEGIELMGYAPIGGLTVTRPYAEDKDFELLAGAGDFLTARPGMFFIFHPGDAHMPCIAPAKPAPVRKIVIKVASFALSETAPRGPNARKTMTHPIKGD